MRLAAGHYFRSQERRLGAFKPLGLLCGCPAGTPTHLAAPPPWGPAFGIRAFSIFTGFSAEEEGGGGGFPFPSLWGRSAMSADTFGRHSSGVGKPGVNGHVQWGPEAGTPLGQGAGRGMLGRGMLGQGVLTHPPSLQLLKSWRRLLRGP